MVDIDQGINRKSNKGINLLNHLFRKRSKRNLNEMVRCLSGASNEKLDQLLSKSMNNMNNSIGDEMVEAQNHNSYEMKTDKMESNYTDSRRRLSTPIIPIDNLERKLQQTSKKLSLKMRRSFSPKSRLIINQNEKKMSLDQQQLIEQYNQLTTECNSSYMNLISNSPISARVKSIDDDIEAITLSRQDNPFIQNKLEKLSHYTGIDCDILSISNLSLNNAASFVNNLNQSQNSSHSNQSAQSNQFNKTPSISSEELDEILNLSGKATKEDNLHQHLIRSPPPNFPQNFSAFVFPAINSPLKSLSEKYSNSMNSSDTFLSPLKTPKSTRTQLSKNVFFNNSNKNNLKNLSRSNDSQLFTNENDVELIITS